MTDDSSSILVDRTIEYLASARHRRLLRYLAEQADTPLEREDLARYLQADDDMTITSLELALIHHHLPKLAEIGLIEYDRRSGVVRATERAEHVLPLLDACEKLEEAWR